MKPSPQCYKTAPAYRDPPSVSGWTLMTTGVITNPITGDGQFRQCIHRCLESILVESWELPLNLASAGPRRASISSHLSQHSSPPPNPNSTPEVSMPTQPQPSQEISSISPFQEDSCIPFGHSLLPTLSGVTGGTGPFVWSRLPG